MVRLGHAQSPRAAAPSPEQEAHFDEYKKKRGMSRFGSWAPGKLFDSALQKAVGKALNAVEAMVVIEDPYMPKCFGLRDLATATKKQLWVEVKDALNDMINESISSADADYRHMRLRNWAAYPTCGPPTAACRTRTTGSARTSSTPSSRPTRRGGRCCATRSPSSSSCSRSARSTRCRCGCSSCSSS